jgi:hypothetical protein
MRLCLNILLVLGLALAALPSPAPARMPAKRLARALPACKFFIDTRTLRDELAGAPMVLVGTLTRATPANPDGGAAEGVTDLVVGQTLKLPPGFRPQKTVTLHRYIPQANQGKMELLVFVDIFKGKLDPYRGILLKANSALPKYVAGILKVRDQKPPQRLRFYFDHLASSEAEIANDALREFQKAEYKDVRAAAGGLPPDKLVAWLRKPGLRPDQRGYYAFLLAHCSKDPTKDARLLRSLADEAIKRATGSLDRFLVGYILLGPKEGFQYTRSLLQDPKKDFLVRYAALRALRFFMDPRPAVLPRQDILQAVALLLPQEDIADLAVEQFRQWKAWELTPHVLAVANTKAHSIPIVRRALLRFALSSPQPEARQFIAEKRKTDPQAVLDAEELLKLERAQPPVPK